MDFILSKYFTRPNVNRAQTTQWRGCHHQTPNTTAPAFHLKTADALTIVTIRAVFEYRMFEAKAKATTFCPQAVLEVEDSLHSGPHPWLLCVCHIIYWKKTSDNVTSAELTESKYFKYRSQANEIRSVLKQYRRVSTGTNLCYGTVMLPN